MLGLTKSEMQELLFTLKTKASSEDLNQLPNWIAMEKERRGRLEEATRRTYDSGLNKRKR